MSDGGLTDSFLVDSVVISHGDLQYELLSGLDEEGPFIELWLCQKAEDEARMLYSYRLNDQNELAFQKHSQNAPPDLEAMFVSRSEKLIPMLNEQVSHLPRPVQWLYREAYQ